MTASSPPARSLELEDAFDLDGDVIAQPCTPDRQTRMPAALAEDVDEEVGSAVDHLRMIGEGGQRVDIAGQAQAAANPVEIAVQRHAQMGDQIERGEARRLP